MKNLKKFSALILSLLLILTAVFIPATITASAADELPDPTKSLLYGIAPSSTLTTASGVMYACSDNTIQIPTDGNTTAEAYFTNGVDSSLIWMLNERSTIESIAMWGPGYATSIEYEIYVADNSANLFSEENKVYTHNRGEEADFSASYAAVVDKQLSGTIVALKFTSGATDGTKGTRINEFAVYGSAAPETAGTFYSNKYITISQQTNYDKRSLIADKAPIIYNRASTAADATSVTALTQPDTIGNLTDADVSAYNTIKTDLGATAAQPWSRIVYELDTLYDVTGFTVYTANLERYMNFEIYVGTDKDNVFTGSPIASGCTYSETDGLNLGTQILLADNAVKKALYVGFAFENVGTIYPDDTTIRLKELQVFGTKTSGYADKRTTSSSTEVTDAYLANSVIKDTPILFVNNDSNAANNTWVWDNTSMSAYFNDSGALGKKVNDGTLTGNHVDFTGGSPGKLVWQLDNTTDITGFQLFNHVTTKAMMAYEVYASENLADLFDTDNMVYSYDYRDADGNVIASENVAGGRSVEFYGENIKKANFVAVWIHACYWNGANHSTARITEIAFFGNESNATSDKVYAIPAKDYANQSVTASFDLISTNLDSNFTYANSLLKSENYVLKNSSGTVVSTPSNAVKLTDGDLASGEYSSQTHEYITYYLGAPTEVTGFAHIKSNAYATPTYKIYVGYSADTLFNEENLAFDMSDASVGTRLTGMAVKFNAPKKGMYFGVEYTGVWGTSSAATYTNCTRIREIAAWGTQEDLGYELTPSIPATSNVAATSEYDNLLKGLVAETGYYGSVRDNGINWLNGITDGVANLHYDMNYTAESAAAASELLYDLGYTATAYEFAYWMTCAGRQFSYQVYMSDSLDTLYKEPVLVWDYKISPDSVGQKFVLDEPLQVRYVAIRMGDTRVANDSFRTSEIALFGTRDNKAIEGESFATVERVDVEAVDNPTYITYTNTFNFPAGQLSGVAKIEEIGTLVYPTTALGDTPLTLDFDGAAKAKSDEKALAEITEYDEAGYTAVKAQSTFRGLKNVGDTTKLTAVSYVIVRYDENTVNTYYSAPMVYSKTQMKRLAAKEQINTYGLLSTDGIITPVDGKTPWNCAIAQVWSYAMQAKNLLKTNKTEPIKNAGAWLTDVKTQYGIEQEWLDNGLVTMGDTSRISAVIRKLMKGESVTVVGLGGSITEGYFSGDGSEQSRRVADFLAASFGEDKVTYVNAGIAATGAVMGAYRLNADVLSHNPDLVIIEYAVNDDRGDETAMAAYENIVRTLLSKDIAVLALHNITFADNDNVNTRRMNASGSGKSHENIGKLYSLPQVSAVDAFFDTDIYAKGNDTTLYYYGTADRPNDGTHPNEKGHAASGALMANLIYTVMCNLEKLPTESAAIPTYPSQPQGNFIDADKAVIVKAQEVNDDGDARVAIEGAAYTESTLAVGKDTTRTNNTYNGYYTVAAGTTATLTLTNVSDAFLVVLENANGDKDAQVVTKDADGNVILENTLYAYYNGALSVDAARIINSDERVYHGETATVTVEVTATDAPVYIGGVMGCFN